MIFLLYAIRNGNKRENLKIGPMIICGGPGVIIYRRDATGGMSLSQEDEWIARAMKGDMQALEELIRLYYADILRYCVWHAPCRAAAEDAAQETFLKAVRGMGVYAHRGRFRAYLYQIARNTCIDMRRRQARADVPLEEIGDAACEEPGFARVREDMHLAGLVRGLPPEQREIVLLRFGQNLTLREAALVLGVPLRTAQSRLRLALKKIKRELEEE